MPARRKNIVEPKAHQTEAVVNSGHASNAFHSALLTAVELRKQGLQLSEIATSVGVSESCVEIWVKDVADFGNAQGKYKWAPEDDARLKKLSLEGKTDAEIASRLGRTIAAIKKRRQGIGILRRRKNFSSEYNQRVVDLYKNGKRTAEIAELFGVSEGTVRYRLKKLGVALRRSGPKRKFDDAMVCRMYRAGASIKEIVEKTGVKNSAVFYDILKRNGVPTRLKRHKLDAPQVRREIMELYAQGLTRIEIAKKMRISREFIGKFLTERGVQARVRAKRAVDDSTLRTGERRTGFSCASIYGCERDSPRNSRQSGITAAMPAEKSIYKRLRTSENAQRLGNRFYELTKRVNDYLMSSDASDDAIAAACGCLVEFVRRQRRFISA